MLKRYMKNCVLFISTHCIIANSPHALIRIMSIERTRNMLSIIEYLIALLCGEQRKGNSANQALSCCIYP